MLYVFHHPTESSREPRMSQSCRSRARAWRARATADENLMHSWHPPQATTCAATARGQRGAALARGGSLRPLMLAQASLHDMRALNRDRCLLIVLPRCPRILDRTLCHLLPEGPDLKPVQRTNSSRRGSAPSSQRPTSCLCLQPNAAAAANVPRALVLSCSRRLP